MKIITGTANPLLAQDIAQYLGVPLTNIAIRRFLDNEIFVQIMETVRGEDVFIIQPTHFPANDHIMELLIMVDAVRRSSAQRITVVLPYYAYSRQDRKTEPRTPITAKLIASMLECAGIDRILTLDLHALQIQGFFDVPIDNILSLPLFYHDIKKNKSNLPLMIVSPDVGGVMRARALAKRLKASLAIIDKRRESAGVSEVMHVIGDPKDFYCILVDDIIDSGGTLCHAAEALKQNGAIDVAAYVAHGVFSGNCVQKIQESFISELVVTNSIKAQKSIASCKKIRFLNVASLIATAIFRIANGESISSLLEEK